MPNKKVKIVATLGPASSSHETIYKLAREGADIFRLNLAHQTISEVKNNIRNIRQVERELGRPIAIMGDLAGPKIRIETPRKFIVETDQRILLTGKKNPKIHEIALNIPSILKSLKPGADIYLGDGAVKLQVIKKTSSGLITKVQVGGELRPRMGFAAEGMKLKFVLSKKDRADLAILMKSKADAVAVSFIQSKHDIKDLNALVKGALMTIAKIETADAVSNIEEIFDEADGVMIARGDLGLTTPLAELPLIQKRIIRLGLKKAKPVITATQMLESMIVNPLPTRAEVTDIANAILDGTDAVMLSGETAMGKFPTESVKMMRKIIMHTTDALKEKKFSEEEETADAVGQSVVNIADQIEAKAIIVFTESGSTARLISRHRANLPIIALTPRTETLHRLNFYWGVYGEKTKITYSFNEMIEIARSAVKNNPIKKLKRGDKFVISAGVPFGKAGSTNLILVQNL